MNYDEYVEYYKKLNTPSSSPKPKGSPAPITPTPPPMPVPTPTPTPTNNGGSSGNGNSSNYSSSYDEPDPAEEFRNFYTNLKRAINSSKGTYEDDISSLTSDMSEFDLDSPIMCALKDWIEDYMRNLDYSDQYQTFLDNIDELISMYG